MRDLVHVTGKTLSYHSPGKWNSSSFREYARLNGSPVSGSA